MNYGKDDANPSVISLLLPTISILHPYHLPVPEAKPGKVPQNENHAELRSGWFKWLGWWTWEMISRSDHVEDDVFSTPGAEVTRCERDRLDRVKGISFWWFFHHLKKKRRIFAKGLKKRITGGVISSFLTERKEVIKHKCNHHHLV